MSGSQEVAGQSEPPPDVLTGPFTIPAISEMGMGERETLTGATPNRCAKPRDQGRTARAAAPGADGTRRPETGSRPAGPRTGSQAGREEALGCPVGAPDPAV